MILLAIWDCGREKKRCDTENIEKEKRTQITFLSVTSANSSTSISLCPL